MGSPSPISDVARQPEDGFGRCMGRPSQWTGRASCSSLYTYQATHTGPSVSLGTRDVPGRGRGRTLGIRLRQGMLLHGGKAAPRRELLIMVAAAANSAVKQQ